jgi:hypothetical protein
MAAGFGEGGGEDPDAEEAPISGTRAERYQVVLHVEPETLTAAEEPGRSELEDGTRVSAETSRRLSCDCGLVRINHAPDGAVLDVGRRTRTISPALRRALEARDRGCRFPGCGLRFAEGHHVRHWSEGGETSLDNCVLLCRYHHRLVHEGGWQVGWWGPGRAVFYDPRGGTHFDGRWEPPGSVSPDAGERPERTAEEKERRPEPGSTEGEEETERPGDEDLVEALITQNRHRGVRPDGWTAGARWKHKADIPDQVYFRAHEALGEARP